MFEFDRSGKFVREIGQDSYGFLVAQQVRVDPQDNIWIVDQMSSMVMKFDPNGQVVGEMKEDSNGLLRRFMPTFFGMPILPGRWSVTINGQHVVEVVEQRTFFTKKFNVMLTPGGVDRRFGIGCAMLCLMREIMRESK